MESEQIFFTIIALIKVFPPSENEPAFAARAVENIENSGNSITRVLAGSSEMSEKERRNEVLLRCGSRSYDDG
jgi:hypothetical protein